MSTDSLYIKYQNIQKFIVDYRRYELENDAFYDLNQFTEKIQSLSYIKHTLVDRKNNTHVILFFFKEDSKYIKVSQYFRQFMEGLERSYDDKKIEVILIVKTPLVSHIKNSLLPQFNTRFPVHVYYHRVFTIEINKGALCSHHSILTPEEVNYLCSHELWVLPTDLPIIYADDPQCIWIGAKAGDVIKIDSLSDLTGKTLRYRYVTQLQERFTETEDMKDEDDEVDKPETEDPAKEDEDEVEVLSSSSGEEAETDQPGRKKEKKGGESFIDKVYGGGSDSESYSADCTSSDDEH